MLTLVAVAAMASVSCTVEPPAAPKTQIAITTLRTWCGGMIPPPGEPWCRTSPGSRAVEVRSGRTVIAELVTDSNGSATVDVEPGRYVLAAADPQVYEECDAPVVTAAESTTAEVVQTCTIMAP